MYQSGFVEKLDGKEKYLKEKGIRPNNYPRTCFVTGAEKLFPEHRQAIEEVFAFDERHVPKAGDAARIFFDGNLHLKPFKQRAAFGVEAQVIAQLVQAGKLNRWADEKHGLVLQCRENDLVRCADAVNVRGAIRDGEIARVHHAEINVQRLPELFRAPGAFLRTVFAARKRPAFADEFGALHVFASVLVKPAHIGFEPRIEDGDAGLLQELAHAIAPAGVLLHFPRGDEIHRAGEIDPRSLQQAAFFLRFGHARKVGKAGGGFKL